MNCKTKNYFEFAEVKLPFKFIINDNYPKIYNMAIYISWVH